MLKTIRPGRKTYVVELEIDSLTLVAGLLHEFIKEAKESAEKEQAVKTLKDLNFQTECVSMNAVDHKIRTTRAPRQDDEGLITLDMIGPMQWAAHLEIVENNGQPTGY